MASSITTAGRRPYAATSRCTRDSAVISAAAVCASHAASRAASSASSPSPWILRACDFGRRVTAAACWSISHRVRFDGGCPYLR